MFDTLERQVDLNFEHYILKLKEYFTEKIMM